MIQKLIRLELYIDRTKNSSLCGKICKKTQSIFLSSLIRKAEPFHYYIRIEAKAIALNMEIFNAKIDKAVRKAKKELSLEYDISEEEIQKIIDEKSWEETDKAS